MHYNKLGKTGLQVSALGLQVTYGTDVPADDAAQRSLFGRATAYGINWLAMTTPQAEAAVGRWLQDIRRDDVLLVTSVELSQVPPDDILRSLEESLRRLGTDYIDIVLLHGSRADLQHGEAAAAIGAARAAGKVRCVGLAADHDTVMYGLVNGEYDVVCVEYSVADASAGKQLLPLAGHLGVGVLAAPVHSEANHAVGAEQALQFVLANERIHGTLLVALTESQLQWAVETLDKPLPAAADLEAYAERAGGLDSLARCTWVDDPLLAYYHDWEWGHLPADDARWFEFVVLETFQAGLSWKTILNKRKAFRRAFAGFDVAKVARFTEEDVEQLLGDAAIVRNRKKILAAVENAQIAERLIAEHGSLTAYFLDVVRPAADPLTVLQKTFRFVGRTTAESIAFATGVAPPPHAPGCFLHEAAASAE